MFGNRNKEQPNITVNIDLDYETLAKAIVKAEREADEIKERKEKSDREKKRNELLKKYGYKEEKPHSRFWAYSKLICLARKKDAQDDIATVSMMKMVAETVLQAGELLLYVMIAASVYGFINPPGGSLSVAIVRILFVFILLESFLFSRFLRISRFEIDKLEDREYINAVVSSIMAVVGTLIAIIALFKGII